MISYIFIIDMIILALLILTIIKQFKLQHIYKNLNGLKFHRYAFILVTISLALETLATFLLRLCSPEHSYWQLYKYCMFDKIELVIIKSFLLIAVFIVFLWFRDSKFKFLKFLVGKK